MQNFVIFTDSSSDLPISVVNELGIKVVQLTVTLEGEEPKPNDLVNTKEFYDALRTKKTATTSTPSINGFIEAFEPFVAEGNDMLYLGFSSGLSGTYNAGSVAAAELSEKYPDRKIFTVDTLCASLGQGLIVYSAAKMRENGASIEDVRDFVENNKLNLCHWFTVDDLFFLKRGGRVSAATAVMGTMLSIKPVMHVDNAGKLINVEKARGRKAAIEALLRNMRDSHTDIKNQPVFISHGDCLEDAEYLADLIKKEFGVEVLVIDYVGPVIGAHSGPGTLALFFYGKQR
jgi:DegV family protein with EDD domain